MSTFTLTSARKVTSSPVQTYVFYFHFRCFAREFKGNYMIQGYEAFIIQFKYHNKIIKFTAISHFKKEAHGPHHIAHRRKQFKSINTYDFTITLTKRGKNPVSTFLELNGSTFEKKNESPSSKYALCKIWLNLAQWFWKR